MTGAWRVDGVDYTPIVDAMTGARPVIGG